jgi:hypothetical protein
MTQYLQLYWLSFAHTTPSGFYCFYPLYRFPEREWLNFICAHELPHWHHSPHITTGESALLSDKHHFAETMRSADLLVIESILQLARGEKVFARNAVPIAPAVYQTLVRQPQRRVR